MKEILKNKKVLYMIMLGVLFIISVSVTYAFFSLTVSGNEDAKQMTVETGTLSLVFKDGVKIEGINIRPGWSQTKTFTVTNTGTFDTSYNMIFKDLINEIRRNELRVSYTCTSYTGYVDSNNKGTVSGTCNSVSDQAVPLSESAINSTITRNIDIGLGITHEYTLTIEFIETNDNQNYNQGKDVNTKINIEQYAGNLDVSSFSLSVEKKSIEAEPTTGNDYLVWSSCNNNATLGLDADTGKFYIDNYNSHDTYCAAELEEEPLLVDMPLGSYVSYTGTNGCPTTEVTGRGAAASADACSGKNANQNADTSNYTYGYCYSENNKFYTYGWRLAYTLDSDSDGTKEAYIVTAGSPECVAGISNDSTSTIASLNAAAIKYCNSTLAYGGTCQSTYNASSANTWAMNGKDFYNITNQWYGEGRRLYSYDTATENSSGTTCSSVYSTKQCGYNSDIIDNGGWYWFGSAYSTSRTLNWDPSNRYVSSTSNTNAYGARPVVHLKSGIRVKGGSGTMDDPYLIG